VDGETARRRREPARTSGSERMKSSPPQLTETGAAPLRATVGEIVAVEVRSVHCHGRSGVWATRRARKDRW